MPGGIFIRSSFFSRKGAKEDAKAQRWVKDSGATEAFDPPLRLCVKKFYATKAVGVSMYSEMNWFNCRPPSGVENK